jgi:putative endonuclease
LQMFQVYILYSQSIDHFYIGQTENLDSRKIWHDDKVFPKNFTVQANDWVIFLTINCISRKQAVNIEAHIKKMKSKKYIKDLVRYPEIIEKLKIKYIQ